ncbi:branched-chain amino acid ABC transporter permease [Pusillimonas sp. DMV24BSW_D]|uniref:Branched-chain amino acid ABC transporter permease n=1 Tax=Neopusillimonas maritima TaxID=2026239 RepID=A0A3A1YLF3_9BURK|nr:MULTISPECIES: branched-chain amino acid ABC transporter permease [Alcaligenaceae]QIM50053.1 branched-chain amino acid ABC transporter permease [Pusillimonas sp. DMV24BSW_D]RIY38982.1 hypothetical protein CJP73_15855 [Neopusillimonas maritima]
MIDPYIESVLIFTGINIILALSLYLPVSAGLLSLGQGGFMAIGAYASSACTVFLGLPFGAALILGALAAGLVGAVVGFPALRIKGVYLIILTMGFGEITRVFFLNFEPTGAASGLGGIEHETTLVWVYGIVAVLLFLFFQLRRSRLGRVITTIRDDELAAEVVGVNLARVKIAVFAFGAAIGGIGGGLYAHYALFIDPAQFGFHKSAEIFVMVLLGGMGNYLGATLGAIVFTLLPELLRELQDWRMTIFGSLLVILMIVRPWGLIGAKR